MGDFAARMDALAESVGDGDLVGHVVVDQVYAHYQHEHPEFRHPLGGQAFYLSDPLLTGADQYAEAWARDALEPDGLIQASIANVEALSGEVARLAPVELSNLRASAHPSVEDNGALVYDRPPEQRRLSEDELRAMHRHGGAYRYRTDGLDTLARHSGSHASSPPHPNQGQRQHGQ